MRDLKRIRLAQNVERKWKSDEILIGKIQDHILQKFIPKNKSGKVRNFFSPLDYILLSRP